jgi:hypothetical protein
VQIKFVDKSVQIGSVGVYFDGELQLSEKYCSENNLYRNKELNANKEKAGFFEENRRVRVQKFMKVKSEGLFMPLESLEFTGTKINKLKIGDAFDEIENEKICCKYISARTLAYLNSKKNNQKKVKVIEAPMFKEHLDSEQLAYYIDTIPVGALLSFEHKWHGTSGRATYTKTKRLNKIPNWLENTLAKFYQTKFIGRSAQHANGKLQEYKIKYPNLFSTEKWEYLAGSRRVVIFPEQADKEGFHGKETWRFDIIEQLKPYLAKGMTIYFEVVGFVNGSPIMGKHDVSKLKDPKYTNKYGKEITYKYGCLDGTHKIKIYRINLSNEDGESVDLTYPQMVAWCDKRGLPCSKPLIPSFIYDGDKEKLMELVKKLAENEENLCEDYIDPSHINEGCVVRVDYKDLVPSFYKYKSFPFKVLEGIAKDTSVDMEDAS